MKKVITATRPGLLVKGQHVLRRTPARSPYRSYYISTSNQPISEVKHAEASWLPKQAQGFVAEWEGRYEQLSPQQAASEVAALLQAHHHHMDDNCIVLEAATNAINPRAAAVLSSTIGVRPSLGHPGAKYETGLEHASKLEVLATTLLKRLFGCKFVEHRVYSGSMAIVYALLATTKAGDVIMSLPSEAAGHPTHHSIGAAGLMGRLVKPVPFDPILMNVDMQKLAEEAAKHKPKLIIIGTSLCMFPYQVEEIRKIADEVGAYLLYDAAHVSGLIAGGHFQNPFLCDHGKKGAHIMTSSTYKSFGGPPGGFVATNDEQIAERLDSVCYPGLTANFNNARTAALAITCADWLQFGPAYAQQCIDNAQCLAGELFRRGVPIHLSRSHEIPEKAKSIPLELGNYATHSHLLAIQAHKFGGGDNAAKELEKANIIAGSISLPLSVAPGEEDNNGLRFGTAEITRRGMKASDMGHLADLIARVLLDREDPSAVKRDAIAMRKRFSSLHYVQQ